MTSGESKTGLFALHLCGALVFAADSRVRGTFRQMCPFSRHSPIVCSAKQ